MLYAPAPEFRFRVGSHDGTRPGAAEFGTTVTSGGSANAYGSYAEVLSDTLVTEDCYGILINVNSLNLTSNARGGTLTIGKDDAGGTSYTDWLTDLIVGDACDPQHGPGFNYYFPMFIKAGTALAAKLACSTGAQTAGVNITLFGRPRDPGSVFAATKFQSFGASNGTGTAITSGTTSEGSWTQLGSNPSFPLKWLQFGWHSLDTTMADIVFTCDVAKGDASNKLVLLEDICARHDASERISMTSLLMSDVDVTTADLLYARAQCSGTADATLQAAIYGVG